MTHVTVRSPRRTAVLMAIVALGVLPAMARASTWTVDDDHKDCPNASFTSIQAAINQAAPHDTIDVCPGTYYESSTPTNNASNPTQAGSTDGLTIQKPLNIVGAGASKVFIEPNPAAVSATNSLAGTAPYLRDGGGAVISITRQSLGNTDFTDNFVSISGVTVESPTVYAEAGIQFFNASGSITDSVVGPLASATASGGTLATRPYGWGIVVSDSLQGAGTGTVYRYVTVSNSLVSGYQAGGILFDDAFGADGAASNNQRSGIIQYGYVDHTRVAGAGPTAVLPQVGIEYHSGERGTVTDSEIVGNDYTPNPAQSVGLLLADAQTTADPNYPSQPGFEALRDSFSGNGYGMYNANAADTAIDTSQPAVATDGSPADEDWWGCPTYPLDGIPSDNSGTGCQGISGLDSTFSQSVLVGAPRSSAPASLSEPGATTDKPPTALIVDPLDGSSDPVGTEIDPIVFATDDFGVKSVTLSVNGTPVGTVGQEPYQFSWKPTYANIGSSVAVTATVTDSANQTATNTIHVNVPVPPGYQAISSTPASFDFGTVYLGLSATQTFTIVNSGQNPLTMSSLGLTGADLALVPGGAGACTGTTSLAIGASCTVTVKFTPAAPETVTGGISIGYSAPGASSPFVVPITAVGKIFSVSTQTSPSGSVPSTLSLGATSSPNISLGAFVAGVAQNYFSTLTLNVLSTAASSLLQAYDASPTATGHLVNGTYVLAQPLQAAATDPANPTATYAPLSSTGAPLTLLSYTAPISSDPVTVTLKQPVGATDPLRTGTYSKTITLVLSTNSP